MHEYWQELVIPQTSCNVWTATYTVICTFSVLEISHVNLSGEFFTFQSSAKKKNDKSLYVWTQNSIFSFSSSAFRVLSIETVATFSALTSDIVLEITSPLSYFCSCLSPHHVVVGFRFSFSYLEIVGNYKQSFINPITHYASVDLSVGGLVNYFSF